MVTGQTKDVGFQFGIRKTFSISPEEAWQFLFSAIGLKIWLGELNNPFEIDQSFKTESGIEGKIRVFKPNSHIRMSWKKSGWENESTLQIRVIDNKGRTTISFHQEKLSGPGQREEMKAYWRKVIDKLAETIG